MILLRVLNICRIYNSREENKPIASTHHDLEPLESTHHDLEPLESTHHDLEPLESSKNITKLVLNDPVS